MTSHTRSSASDCNPRLLQLCLEDRLTSDQEESLDRHLCHCPDCQSQLDQLAADGRSWDRIRNVLTQHKVAPPLPAKDAVHPTFIADGHNSGTEGLTADFAVDFLQPATQPNSIGRLGDIEIQSVIGRGGNGIVLKGHQPELNRPVAVKVMAPHLAISGAARQRFAREAQATAAIVHPNVMPILSVHSGGQLPWLVMPFVACETLQQRLDVEGTLPPTEALRVAHQVAEALAAAHRQGLVHRDVKPANILLEQNVDRVMLTDFGLARAVDDASLTRTGLISGTPHFMSPEQARGDGVDFRSDLFSLGSVLYTMLTGRLPFRAETSYGILRRVTDEEPRGVCDVNNSVPPWLNHLVTLLMQKDREARPESAEEVAGLLEQCLAHLQNPSAHPRPAAMQSGLVRHRRTLIGLLLAVTMMVVVAVGTALKESNSKGTPDASAAASDEATRNQSQTDGRPSPTDQTSPTGRTVVIGPEPTGGANDVETAADNSDAPAGHPQAEQLDGRHPEWNSEVDAELRALDAQLDQVLQQLSQSPKLPLEAEN